MTEKKKKNAKIHIGKINWLLFFSLDQVVVPRRLIVCSLLASKLKKIIQQYTPKAV